MKEFPVCRVGTLPGAEPVGDVGVVVGPLGSEGGVVVGLLGGVDAPGRHWE